MAISLLPKSPQKSSSPDSGIRRVKILVASPGDVLEERKIVEQVIKKWNILHSEERKLVLDAVLWELRTAPESGERTQGIINRQIVDQCDFAIGIFWTRIGTPTGVAPGGAVEEVQRMIAGGKQVMLYFSDKPISPSAIDALQKARIDEFRASIQPNALVAVYDKHSQFKDRLADDIFTQVRRWYCNTGEDETNLSSANQITLDALSCYQATLRENLGLIRMIGLPGVDSAKVNLDDNTFVPLRLSDRKRDADSLNEKNIRAGSERAERILNPDELMKEAFCDGRGLRLLLVIGDPGAGKTTLLKYYTLCALDPKRSRRLGFTSQVNVFYLPLRELLRNEKGHYGSLPENLSLWYKRHHKTLEAQVFEDWLQNGTSLVLLDGLDEISNTAERIEVCKWIDNAWCGFGKGYFVVTSRPTGYRKDEDIELESDYERADVQDFTEEQQKRFLTNWFSAAFLKEPGEKGVTNKEWKRLQCAKADERTKKIVAHLKEEKNKGLRQLAAVPMILQIMAILWKEQDYMPESRVKLYDAALNFMLEFKDKRRGIMPLFKKTRNDTIPVISAERSRMVLEPVSYWMQAVLQSDKSGKAEMQTKMQVSLDTMNNSPSVEEFCDYLVDRAGVLVAYGNDYLFRHKTFREYLASVELVKNVLRSPKNLDTIIAAFGEDWWDEPIKFFIAQGDAEIFDLFMEKFFSSPQSDELAQERQVLLQTIIEEAPRKKVDALCKKLLDTETTPNHQRLILDCLKTINQPAALDALQEFRAKEFAKNKDITSRTDEVIRSLGGQVDVYGNTRSIVINHNEHNAEYILIKKGSYLDSETKEEKRVEDLYFAKYPVTNKLYRLFIKALGEHSAFREELQEIAQNNRWDSEFANYLKDGQNDLAALFRSSYDEDRKFGGDDQPVVGVTWYAAQAYALWLSQLQGKPDSYRLPAEVEWEWAAGGRQGEAVQEVREYPWADEKRKPDSKLLNYNQNVGATTPVGSYPEGATPEGLYDMAGNVWEWTDSWWDETRSHRGIRGGGWGHNAESCRSADRNRGTPDFRTGDVGFRLVFVP